jgi:two-component system LytT family response regulator
MEKLVKTIIVDDEAATRRSLKSRLSSAGNFDVVAEARSGSDALELIRELNPDLVFLDVQMPGMDGFDVLRGLPKKSLPTIIFLTASDAFAIQAFKSNKITYLIKPINEVRFSNLMAQLGEIGNGKHATRYRKSLVSLQRQITGSPRAVPGGPGTRRGGRPLTRDLPRLAIRDGGKTTWLKQHDIEWIDAAGDYMCVHAGRDTHILRETMKSLEEKLDPTILQRIHRSTIVNIQEVQGMRPHINGEFFLTLKRGHTVKLSRSYRSKLKYFRQLLNA